MEGKEISSKEQVENIFTESSGKQVSSFLPSYVKSYSSTWSESTTFDYSWKIDQFKLLHKIIDTLHSPRFPENGENMIQLNIIRKPKSLSIQFYIRTSRAFNGLCCTVINSADVKSYNTLYSKSISGQITDMTLLIEISEFVYTNTDTFIIDFKFEIFQKIISNAIHMNLLPPSTVYSKDVKSENSTVDQFECKNEDTIKFIINKEQYVIPKKLLYATNSSYFKNICLTHKENEKDLTNELITNEIEAFKYLLLFIITADSIKKIQNNYDKLKKLLTIADKYEVSVLKLTCEHYLLRYIMIENAVELIQLAFSSNAKFLESRSATFLKFHKNEIVNTNEFRNLSQKDSCKIMELIEKSEILESSCNHKFVNFVI
ncbi:PREDICTED: protein roadkill-like isoform X1 [Wasmannia auropunctata]|uniref:protein roadkill-like isoform X1 n=1 Tax=Wasmannia auropunctata TaxID=64793 RepID=UPI0005EE0F3E|nr:PREDICTED: protein roadkill-like isoform X1 [Wasmannia auropunctata]